MKQWNSAAQSTAGTNNSMAQSLETQKMEAAVKRHWQSGFHDPNAKVSAKDGAT